MDREEPSADDPTDEGRIADWTGTDADDATGGPLRGPAGRDPIEPEPVNPEHAAFVLLGALLTVVVLVGGL